MTTGPAMTAEGTMRCKSCGSTRAMQFPTEACVHLPGMENLTKAVYVLAPLVVCLDCGFAALQIPPEKVEEIKHEGGLRGEAKAQ